MSNPGRGDTSRHFKKASKPRPKRAAPTSVRFTPAERELLLDRANGLPLSAYIKSVLFGPDAPILRKRPIVTVDTALLARVLGSLGASRLSSNLNQLAKAANLG